ncbi:MAG: hypothetical protein NVS9B13_26250 [Candidatus Acidiferrum sp.]
MRSVVTAETAYAATYMNGYGNLAQLGTPVLPCAPSAVNACLLDSTVSTGNKSGYTITVTPGAGAMPSTYVGAAAPNILNTTGTRTFCVDETGVIRFDVAGGAAPASDAVCQGFPAIQ